MRWGNHTACAMSHLVTVTYKHNVLISQLFDHFVYSLELIQVLKP